MAVVIKYVMTTRKCSFKVELTFKVDKKIAAKWKSEMYLMKWKAFNGRSRLKRNVGLWT